MVVEIGTSQNTTDNTVGSLVVEAKLTDSAGKLVVQPSIASVGFEEQDAYSGHVRDAATIQGL